MKAFLFGAALLGLATAAQAQVLTPAAGVPVTPSGAINSATATPAGIPITPGATSTVPSAATSTLPGTASPVTGTVSPLTGSTPVGVGAPATPTTRSVYGNSARPARTRSTTTRATTPAATPTTRP